MYVLAMWYSNHHLTLPWSDAELSLPFAVDMEEIPDGYIFFFLFYTIVPEVRTWTLDIHQAPSSPDIICTTCELIFQPQTLNFLP